MGNSLFGFQELISRPNMPVLLGWTIKNTDTLLKIHPVEFRVISEELRRFSRFSVWILVQPLRFPRRFRFLIVRTGARNHGSFADFWVRIRRSSELATYTVKLRLSRNGKLLQKTLGKLRGASWRVYGCFWPSCRVKRVFSAKTLRSWSPKIISHNRWPKRSETENAQKKRGWAVRLLRK